MTSPAVIFALCALVAQALAQDPTTTGATTTAGTTGTGPTTTSGPTTTAGATTAASGATTTAATTVSGATTAASGATTAASGATTTAATTTASSGDCKNFHSYCCAWASAGECDKNGLFMKTVCQKACGTCGATISNYQTKATNTAGNDCPASSSTVPGAVPSVADACIDSNQFCAYWGSTGECTSNAPYMSVMCRKTCGC